MKYAVIDPFTRAVRIVDRADLRDALREAGLKPGEVDHGTIKPGLAIVVNDRSLSVPPDSQSYFSINGRLYGGPAVAYAYEEGGQSIDLPADLQLEPFILWLPKQANVEVAIACGVIARPRIAVGDRVFWQWPEPEPSEELRGQVAEEMARAMARSGTVVIDGDTVITSLPDGTKH